MSVAYEEAYQRPGPLFSLRAEPWLVRLVVDQRLHGRAMDLGCGDGRNSVFLSCSGFEVNALDSAASAIADVRRAAEALRLPIQATVGDVRDPVTGSEEYDLVAADTVICHLHEPEAQHLAGQIYSALRQGGWLYASGFGVGDPRQSEFAPLVRSYFDCDGFAALFEGFRVARCEQVNVLDRSHGRPHGHVLVRLLAQKER